MNLRDATGLRRSRDGILTRIRILIGQDGSPYDMAGYPLTRTEETTYLRGWGDLDGVARVWTNDGGREILVSEEA